MIAHRQATEADGVFPLDGVQVASRRDIDTDASYKFQFILVHPSHKELSLCAVDSKDMTGWMEDITQAVISKLDEVKKKPSQTQTSTGNKPKSNKEKVKAQESGNNSLPNSPLAPKSKKLTPKPKVTTIKPGEKPTIEQDTFVDTS